MSKRIHEDIIQAEWQPQRMRYCLSALAALGIDAEVVDKTCLQFKWKSATVRVWPYTGWFTGKTVKDGRGILNLIKQLRDEIGTGNN